MPELTPRDDIRKRVSEILKRVDQLIKKSDLDQAQVEIERAKGIDPRNVYILAYEERLTVLKDAQERARQAEAARLRAAEEARKKAEEERARRQEEEQRKADEQKRKQEEDARRLEEEKRKSDEESRRVQELAQKTAEPAADHAESLRRYKLYLLDAWADGATSDDEEEKLRQLRILLGVTEEEHVRLEREAKTESYLKAFKNAWASGSITPERASALAEFRRRFQISQEEFDKIEAQVLWTLRAEQQRPSLLVIDDDTKLLDVIAETLEEGGFNVICFPSSDDAYRFLKNNSPDLIISDINLETSTMGGFTFYEKVRELEHLQEVPFIFLSGLTDEVLIRTGKELGVDDYLTKPFSEETLLATVRGKLKRYRQLKLARNRKEER